MADLKRYLTQQRPTIRYSGSDILPEFIQHCQERWPEQPFILADIAHESQKIENHDYLCLSGTFHTKGSNAIDKWEPFVSQSMHNMFALARKGISVNFLTTEVDYQEQSLYYRDPREALDWCLTHLSRFVEIRHAVPLYEYSLFVYKTEFLEQCYPEYTRYFSHA